MTVINTNGTASLASALIASNPKGYLALRELQRKLASPKNSKDAAWAAAEKMER